MGNPVAGLQAQAPSAGPALAPPRCRRCPRFPPSCPGRLQDPARAAPVRAGDASGLWATARPLPPAAPAGQGALCTASPAASVLLASVSPLEKNRKQRRCRPRRAKRGFSGITCAGGGAPLSSGQLSGYCSQLGCSGDAVCPGVWASVDFSEDHAASPYKSPPPAPGKKWGERVGSFPSLAAERDQDLEGILASWLCY